MHVMSTETLPTCDHCGNEFESDEEWVELQPWHVIHESEPEADNMGWRVHWDEAEELVRSLRAEYDYGER